MANSFLLPLLGILCWLLFFYCRVRLAYVEKPIDFWLRKGKAVGETKPTENKYGTIVHLSPSTSSSTSAAFSSFVHCPACHAGILKSVLRKVRNLRILTFLMSFFLHDNLDQVDKVLLPVCQLCQLRQLCQCIFLHRQLFRMISGSSSFFISVAHLQQPTCFQSLVISCWYLNYLLFITGIISVQLHRNLY